MILSNIEFSALDYCSVHYVCVHVCLCWQSLGVLRTVHVDVYMLHVQCHVYKSINFCLQPEHVYLAEDGLTLW